MGSFLFVPDYANFIAGSWLFIVGSGLYASGAIINMAQIYLVQDALMIQFQMITGSFFFILYSSYKNKLISGFHLFT